MEGHPPQPQSYAYAHHSILLSESQLIYVTQQIIITIIIDNNIK